MMASVVRAVAAFVAAVTSAQAAPPPAPVLATPTTAPAPAPSTAQADAAFRRLTALVGTWRVADRPQSPLRIQFATTAAGTVLVESWLRNGAPYSLTLYHRNGARLIATHYCPQGNQPRLALTTNAPVLRFAFQDATDLAPQESHLQSLAFDLTDPARPIRHERYRRDTIDGPESILSLVRVVEADAG